MLPVDFIRRVVAWPGSDEDPGWINLHWQPGGESQYGMHGRPFKNIYGFMEFFEYAANKPGRYKEIYFCLSTQKETGKVSRYGSYLAHRHASKAIALKALWLDVDVKPGKGYETFPDAINAITAFRNAVGLPPPTAIVTTGGGLHIYWISDKPLTPEQWRPYAEGLKAEAIRLGLKCDPISADAARVLRVPGSTNNKQAAPRPVRLRHLEPDDYDFTSAPFMALAAKAPPRVEPKQAVTVAETPYVLPPEFAKGQSKLLAHLDPKADNLADGIGHNDLPLDPTEIFRSCQHFRNSFKTRGKSQSQGLWMLNGLVCTWIENGREIYHALSKGYPTYTPDETDKMFDRKLTDKAQRNLGWPACSTLEGEGAGCKGCPYKGNIRSPLNLADRVRLPPPPVIIGTAPDELDLPTEHVVYTVNEKGLICEVIDKIEKNGDTTTTYVPLFWSKLRGFRAQAGKTRTFIFETSLDRGKWGRVELIEAVDLINEVAVLKALRAHGVKPNTQISAKRIITFVTSFMAKLDELRERQDAAALGWIYRDGNTLPVGFAYGGRVVMHDGSEHPAGYADRTLEEFYKPKGTDEVWWKLLHMVTKQHYPALEIPIAASFGAPLAYASGLDGCLFNVWSREGGTHKSTSLDLGAAVWSRPKVTKEHPGSSQKGIIHKLGILKNLPVYWDEINRPELMREVFKILGSNTQGSGGSKLTSGRNFHEYDEWQTMMVVGANLSLVNMIINDNTGTDSQLHRVFEYEVLKKPDTEKSHVVDTWKNALGQNYGQIGMLYSKLLATNIERIAKLVNDTSEKFRKEVAERSEERFRRGAAVTTYVGAVLANEIGCNFNTEEIWEFLKTKFLEQRMHISSSDVIAGTAASSLDWLTQFMKTFNENAVWFNDFPVGQHRPSATGAAKVFIAGVTSQRPRPVHMRLIVSRRTIEISYNKLTDWLKQKEIDAGGVVRGLFEFLHAQPSRATLSAGTGVIGGARERTIVIPVPVGHALESDLFAHSTPAEQAQVPAVPQITATVIPIRK